MSMTNLPWIKLYTELIDDPKLFELSRQQKWLFVQLLLLAGMLDAEGYLVSSGKPLDPRWIAWRLRWDLQELEDDLQALAQADLVEWDAEQASWLIPSFAQRQARPDDGQRLRWREKKRRQRAKDPEKKQPVHDPPGGLDDEEAASLQPEVREAGEPEAELPAPLSSLWEAEERASGLISQLAAKMSSDPLLDRRGTVPLKRRGD
jgi:hypothetical protein